MTLKLPVILSTTDHITQQLLIDVEITDAGPQYPEKITRDCYMSDGYNSEGPTFLGQRTYSRIVSLAFLDDDLPSYYETTP